MVWFASRISFEDSHVLGFHHSRLLHAHACMLQFKNSIMFYNLRLLHAHACMLQTMNSIMFYNHRLLHLQGTWRTKHKTIFILSSTWIYTILKCSYTKNCEYGFTYIFEFSWSRKNEGTNELRSHLPLPLRFLLGLHECWQIWDQEDKVSFTEREIVLFMGIKKEEKLPLWWLDQKHRVHIFQCTARRIFLHRGSS